MNTINTMDAMEAMDTVEATSTLDVSMVMSTKKFQSLFNNHATMISQFQSQFIERSKFHIMLSVKKKCTSPNTSTFISQLKSQSKFPSTLRFLATRRSPRSALNTKQDTKRSQESLIGRELKSAMCQRLSISRYHVSKRDVSRCQCHTRS